MSIDPIYTVFTNTNLLKEITKWHIIEYLNTPKIIKVLMRDTNIEKLHSLLIDKYITFDDLNDLTNKYLIDKNIKCQTSFIDLLYYSNSPKLMNYFTNVNPCPPPNLQIAKDLIPTICNTKTLTELLKKDVDMMMPMFFAQPTNNNEELRDLIEFYNKLPHNNYFDINTIIDDFQNIGTFKNIVFKNLSYQYTNNTIKSCFMCQPRITYDAETKKHDIVILFLLKTKAFTFEYLKNMFNDIIPFFIYNNYHKTIKYIFKNHPNEMLNTQNLVNVIAPNTIFNINTHNIIQRHEIHNYLINACPQTYHILMKYNVNNTLETFIKLLLQRIKHSLERANYEQIINNYTKKIKNDIFTQIIKVIEKHIPSSYDVTCLIDFISNQDWLNKISYLSATTVNLLSVIYDSNYINTLNKDDQNVCVKFMLQYYDKHKIIIPLVLNENIEISQLSRLDILCKNKLYDEALTFILNNKQQQTFNNNIILTYDQVISYCQIQLGVLLFVEILYDNLQLENKDDLFIDILNRYDIYDKFIILIKNHAINIFNSKILPKYMTSSTLGLSGELTINILNHSFNNFIITYSLTFTDEFEKLDPKDKNLCVNTLLSLKNYDILSQVIAHKDVNLDINVVLDILIKYKIYNKAISLLMETNKPLNINMQPLLDHIHINQDSYDIVGIYAQILKLILSIAPDIPPTVLTQEEMQKKLLLEGVRTRDILNNIQQPIPSPYSKPNESKQLSSVFLLELIHNIPKSLNKFCELFIMLCESYNNIPQEKLYTTFLNGTNEQDHTYTNILTEFINNYPLCQHLQYFINLNSNNYLIKNIVIQNMLNNKLIPKTIPENKTIILTQNITKYNFKNIDTIIKNFVKHDHNLLLIMDNYKIKTNINLNIIPSQEIQKYLQKIQYCPGDDYIFNNFDISLEDNWFLEYFIKHNLKDCLTKYLLMHPTIKFDRNHMNMASKNKCLSILNKFKSQYTITLKHKRKLREIPRLL